MSENLSEDVAALAEGLSSIKLENHVAELDEEKKEFKEENVDLKKEKETDDDGYSSSQSEDTSVVKPEVTEEIEDAKEKEEDENKDIKKEEEEEEILQPLSFLEEVKTPDVILTTRGPVTVDHHTQRYGPYRRPQCNGAGPLPGIQQTGGSEQPPPNIMIFKKSDTKTPSLLDVRVTWSDKYELSIDRYLLPDETYYGEEPRGNKVQLLIQLNPGINELKSFMADVRTEMASDGQKKLNFIGPIVISLKTELAESQERFLLEQTTMEGRTAAFNLVNQKELCQLTSGIGPNKDTVLAVLCAQRNPANPGQTYAQIHAVIQRLVSHPDKNVRQTIFRLNNNQISALEIAAITNNSLVACYLAEVMYNLTDDTGRALRILNCRDTQGNTLLHLLARKGDSNKVTIKSLLDMTLTDGTKVFSITANSKKQFPMHIATQNVKNQPETIRILFENFRRSFDVLDDDGMSPLHYACQRTTDVELVRTVLSYKKDNINIRNKDGFTALDLISRRGEVTTQTQGMFAIEKNQQQEIVQLIQNNGGRLSMISNNTDNTNGAMSDYSHNMGYYHNSNSTNSSSSPPHCDSPSGPAYSPYTYSITTSPRTPSIGSPGSINNPPSLDSQGSFPQPSSPDSALLGSPGQLSFPFQPDSPASEVGGQLSYEDQIASQILTQFPEITTVLGQILDQNN